MGIFWRVVFGFGALVFGSITVGVGTSVSLLRAHYAPEPFENSGADSVFLFDVGSEPIRLSTSQFLGGASVVSVVAGGLSVACTYFAFRSDKDKTPMD